MTGRGIGCRREGSVREGPLLTDTGSDGRTGVSARVFHEVLGTGMGVPLSGWDRNGSAIEWLGQEWECH